jgi:hypothetical protein
MGNLSLKFDWFCSKLLVYGSREILNNMSGIEVFCNFGIQVFRTLQNIHLTFEVEHMLQGFYCAHSIDIPGKYVTEIQI